MIKRVFAIFLSIILTSPTAFAADDKAITTPCYAHMGSLGATEPHAYEHYFEWTHVPTAASDVANAKLTNTVQTIAVAPVTEADYRAIFTEGNSKGHQTGISPAQVKEIDRIRAVLKSDYGRDEGHRDFNQANYKAVVQGKVASFVIIIGHNDHGDFHLLDGSTLLLDDVVRAARSDQRVILISCDSAIFVSNKGSAGTITRKISYDEAFRIARTISAFITAAGGPLSIAEIQVKLDRQVNSTMLTHRVAFFVMKAACVGGTAVIVALIVRELDPCTDADKPGCPKSRPEVKPHTKSPILGIAIVD